MRFASQHSSPAIRKKIVLQICAYHFCFNIFISETHTQKLSKIKNGTLLISYEYHTSKTLPTKFNPYNSRDFSETTLNVSRTNANNSRIRPKIPKNNVIENLNFFQLILFCPLYIYFGSSSGILNPGDVKYSKVDPPPACLP